MSLPNVFQNKNIKESDNIQEYYHKKQNEINNIRHQDINIEARIRSLFASTSYVYKLNVTIIFEDKTIDTTIVGKSGNYLLTYDNELIPINKIKDIYER